MHFFKKFKFHASLICINIKIHMKGLEFVRGVNDYFICNEIHTHTHTSQTF